MYQATIFTDSPCLDHARKLLSKQRLAWDEQPEEMNRLVRDLSTGKCIQTEEKAPAIKITVANTKEKLARARNTSKHKTKKPVYKNESLDNGLYRITCPSGYQYESPRPYDEKQQARIQAEAKARINKLLNADFDRSHLHA